MGDFRWQEKKSFRRPRAFTDSLAGRRPDLAEQWNHEKNGCVTPERITHSSTYNGWWNCTSGKHQPFQMKVCDRKKGKSCPGCKKEDSFASSLAANHAELVSEWNCEKNGHLTPWNFSRSSNKLAWWTCPEHPEHIYQMEISRRTVQGQGCPTCRGWAVDHTNGLATRRPDIAAEWHPTRNSDTPADVRWSSTEKRWFLYPCGHEAKQNVYTRSRLGVGCPVCGGGTSRSEMRIKAELAGLGLRVESRAKVAGKELDLWIPEHQLGIEVDGEYFHSSEEALLRDERKNMTIAATGIALVRLRESPLAPLGSYDVVVPKGEVAIEDVKALLSGIARLRSAFRPIADNYAQHTDFVNPTGYIELLKLRVAPDHSLAVTHPLLTAEWDWERNFPLAPEAVTFGAHRKVWWICPEHGSYPASINKRTGANATGCPICGGRRVAPGMSLADLHPELLSLYAQENTASPAELSAGSGRKALWRCAPGYHLYSRSIKDQVRSLQRANCALDIDCPPCRSLAVQRPDLKFYWDFEGNAAAGLNWNSIRAQSNKKANFRCADGHHFQRIVASFLKRPGCPICKGMKAGPALS